MENWIGIGIWIVVGVLAALLIKVLVKRPEVTPGHTTILMLMGIFGALIGGMLGVGLFHFYDPVALSVGGMAGGVVFALFMAWIYRWGIRSMI